MKAVIAMFGDHYLRSPNNIDIARLLQTGEQRGFPGTLGSIDCMHWKWKNCPTAWQGMYTGHCHEPTIILEADGIYPNRSTFVKTIPCPQGLKKKHFAKAQESARKYLERAFGVLQARFAIVRGPARFWDEETLADIMKACIIMHNMVIEDEGDIGNNDFDGSDANPPLEVSHAYTPELEDFIQIHYQIRDSVTHSQLQSDLIEHLWERHGD